ncbi:TonB-dependent receptor domain-containing protein [Psychroserpens algicola]|uniref:TonB-dependent receptor domain-containing protein n=1 Tax=Psychroserpens algicola TaxID=1719034 RepID=UPI001952BC72|nr:TonB-dependent receptor [Psychroserpens algicola]
MKLKWYLLLFTLMTSALGFAQQEITVTGKVIDVDDKAPLEYATISFFSRAQNKVVTGGITDENGNFKIEVPAGTFDVKVEYLSYKTKTYENKTIDKDIDLGTVSLALNLEALDAVEVIAEKTTVEIKLDKKIYNVGRDLTVRGGTVSDVLDNVPSVSVDVEGNVALRGNDNVTILINGKPSGLVGLNSTDALRQLPAESIERVEVITSPSARYDAEGTAGILNIILRRSKLLGLNGAVTLNAGNPTQAGISGNINYRTGDFNFFNTTGYRYRESPGNATTKTEYFNGDDPNTFFDEFRKFDRKSKGINTNFGVEWYVNETSSITASFLYRNSDENNDSSNTINELDANGNLINQSLRLDPEEETDSNIQYSVNYDKQFGDDSQHRLTMDFQYENNSEEEKSIIAEDGDAAERVRTLENENEALLVLDYTRPIGENSNFEFGYRGTFEELDTDYTLEFNENGTFEIDNDVSNNLIYRQYVNAVYSQFGSKVKEKFSFLLGLRMENSRITINQITSGDFDRKTYTNLFPTLNLGYEITEKQSLTFGYNRRIRRPRSRFINPFPSRSSATNLFQGNPDLDPSYSNTVDFGYLNRFGKLTLNSSIYFQRATDVFTFVSLDTGETTIVGGTEVPIIKRTPINLATNDRYGFEFTLTYRPTKKWNLNGNLNLFKSITEGVFEGTDFGADNLSWFARINNKYTLPGDVDWQTRLFYRGPSEDAQNKNKGIFSTDLAFSKDLFDGKASLAVNVNDVFNSRKRQSTATTETFENESEFQWRQRSFNFTFTYRFNQQKERQREGRGDNGGGDDLDFEG